MKVEKIDSINSTHAEQKKTVPQLSVPPETSVSVTNPSTSQTLNPTQSAALQREAALVIRPDLLTAGSDLPSTDRLPCGTLDPAFIASWNLKGFGNIVIIITGPIAGGKDTVAKALLDNKLLTLAKVILYTSRPMGKNEVNGLDYNFVSREQFIEARDRNEFLSWNDLETGFYGVGLNSTRDLLNSKKDIIAVVGPTVAKPLKQGLNIANIPFIEIFVSPVSKNILEAPGGIDIAIEVLKERIRQRNRGGTDETKLDLLMQRSREWLREPQRFQHIIENPNGSLDTAINNVKNLILAKKIELNQTSEQVKHPALSEFEEAGSVNDVYLKSLKLNSKGGFALIISGPSGVGKGTILKEVLFAEGRKDNSLNAEFEKVIGYTTRPKRLNETNGIEYDFITKEEIIEKIKNNELIEWLSVVNGHFYGTSEKQIQKIFDKNKNPILDIDIKGTRFYKQVLNKLGIPTVTVFISPVPKEMLSTSEGLDKAKEILKRRLEGRSSGETKEQIDGRIKKATEYLQAAKGFDYVIENTEGDLEKSVKEFIKIARGHKS